MGLEELLKEHLLNMRILARAENTKFSHNFYMRRLLTYLKIEFNLTKVADVRSIHIKNILHIYKIKVVRQT
ncbi:hypothetical protein [Listeria grayi]|uniref:Uncharacterized protein n=2 Tax=Listeria grayi TaxID=1641 RepID=D7V176_LISGR|nr:hypothetical protein [Listeria grayi]EFI83308.1 hypothetical protein HMPREF0556_11993 [Listeria grayi DSM 20601]STY43669.1 Uncharacterised protein [Listeria grayi]